MFFDENELERESSQTASADKNIDEVLKDRLTRLTADFENFKRRSEHDKRMWYTAAKADVIEKLLPFLDEINLAITSQKRQEQVVVEAISGLELIAQNYQKSLLGLGVTEVSYAAFDPEFHDALGSVHVEGKLAGEIVEVLKRGFSLDNRVLRPAQVIVAKGQDDVA
jgi:molecular chaperone GrpE